MNTYKWHHIMRMNGLIVRYSACTEIRLMNRESLQSQKWGKMSKKLHPESYLLDLQQEHFVFASRARFCNHYFN